MNVGVVGCITIVQTLTLLRVELSFGVWVKGERFCARIESLAVSVF